MQNLCYAYPTGWLPVRAKCRFWKGSGTLPDLAMYSQIKTDQDISICVVNYIRKRQTFEIRYAYLFRE